MRWWSVVDTVKKRLRDRPVEAQVEEIKELLNREHGPVITELRTRFNELLAALNPSGVVLAAGAPVGYVNVTIDGVGYSIQLLAQT